MDWINYRIKLLLLFICFTNQFNESCGKGNEFVIKNLHCGKYIHGWSSTSKYTGTSQYLRLYEDITNLSSWVFEPVDGIWGYIRHSTSNAIWYPYNSPSYTRRDGTNILSSNIKRERWALWAIDQVNNRIIHRDGQHVEYDNGYDPYPPNNDLIELTSSVHDGINWAFLDPKNHSEIVFPYGYPKIVGEWEVVFAVENPTATQKWEYVYTLGKSNTRGTRSSLETHESFEFKWEASVSAQATFTIGTKLLGQVETTAAASMGTSITDSSSTTKQIENSSEDTWYGETQEKSSITVEAGKTVVVWQRVFIGSQLGHKAVFHSNHFAYTDNVMVKPKDYY